MYIHQIVKFKSKPISLKNMNKKETTEDVYSEEARDELVQEDEINAEEEAFMRGYENDKKDNVCEECGSAIHEKPVIKVIEDKKHTFCSKECAQDYAESV